MIKTITLSGVLEINFNADGASPYFYTAEKYWWIKNKSENIVYASLSSEISPNADGTTEIPAGRYAMIEGDAGNKLYLSGSGFVEVHTTAVPVSPYGKCIATGGGSGGGVSENSIAVIKNFIEYNSELTFDTSDLNSIASDIKGYMLNKFKIDHSGVMFEYNNRYIKRDTDDIAYCAYFYSGEWWNPCVLSETEAGATYWTTWKPNVPLTPQGTIEFLGKTWYYNYDREGSFTNAAEHTGRYNLGYYPDSFEGRFSAVTDLANILTVYLS